MTTARYVDLDGAEPGEAVVVIDVLRAFTVEPWMFAQGADRVLTVASRTQARALQAAKYPDALLAGEQGGKPVDGFDLGNSPSEVAATDLREATVIHRTSAGTQGLARTVGSDLVLAASFVNAEATAAMLRAANPAQVVYVITGASLGRNGDEDLAAAELIAARVAGETPPVAGYLDRVAPSDAGRLFSPDGPDWAPPEDLTLAVDVDRFDFALVATPTDDEIVAVAPVWPG